MSPDHPRRDCAHPIAKRKKLIVVGTPENIFQRSLATVVPNWHEAVLELVSLERAKNEPGVGAA